MTRLAALAALMTACGTAYSLRAPKTPADATVAAHARCGRLATARDWLTGAGGTLGALAAADAPIAASVTDPGQHTDVVIAGPVAGALAAVAGVVGGVVASAFSRDCGIAASGASSSSAPVWPARVPSSGAPQ